MPLALDLISTLVMGSILPVATTLLARSPFSHLASLLGSILVPPLLAAISTPARTTTNISAPPMIHHFRVFFFPFPFATAVLLDWNGPLGPTTFYESTCRLVPLFRGKIWHRYYN